MTPDVGRRLHQVAVRYRSLRNRLRRLERREVREFRGWLEHTNNVIHLSVVVFVPLLIGLVTWLSNSFATVSFLLFPPLASGTYTLFADPQGKYSSPGRFVAGLTMGAFSGYLALRASAAIGLSAPPGVFQASASAAALGIFIVGVLTWLFDVEEPSAFSTTLLVLLVGQARLAYVAGVAISSSIVALAFVVWRDRFYEQRAEFLYQTTKGDDHVLVPLRDRTMESTVLFAARLAGAHEAGKVVLLDTVDEDELAAAEASLGDDEAGGAVAEQVAAHSARRAEQLANRVRTKVGVPCEVVVATADGDPSGTVLQTAAETNCDLVVTPYEERHGSLSPFVRRLLAAQMDAVVFKSNDPERARWRRAMVTVRRAGDVAHAMIDFAQRITGRAGSISVCTCIDSETERNRAESMLGRLVEAFDSTFETRVARTDIESFLSANAPGYDLVVLGASTDRSAASRFISPPTFQRVSDVDADVAIVHHD
jgi:nucleotide-binding universal stress UspA family protein